MILARRRAVLRLAAWCALLPSFAGKAVAHVAGRVPFGPPTAPMLYSRRLVRELRDGAHLSVSRSFLVRFVSLSNGGYLLEGEQSAVEVAAPDKMSPFAEIERSRVETGVFPLRLCASGLIERGPAFAASSLLDRALAEARRQLAALPAGERAQSDAFIQSVHGAGAALAAHLPEDLFAPGAHSRSERREIEVPGGEAGQVDMRFAAEADPQTGLMSHARREIVTLIGTDRRTTLEEWTLRLA